MFRVFLVDDEELIMKEIAASVPWMDNGFEVIGMESNSKKAVERVLELKPDVVFSDLRMPYLDGHIFMKTVRDRGLDIEFVMLSAYGTFEDARTFFQQEGFDYLLKPLQIQEAQLVLEKLALKLSRKKPTLIADTEELMNPSFTALVEYVNTNFYEKFTLEQLSKKFGLSAGYICSLFAKYQNTTLTCFVTQIRMEHAAKLLGSSNMTLKLIANECGYNDYFYFNKVFKGYYGVAPSQYVPVRD